MGGDREGSREETREKRRGGSGEVEKRKEGRVSRKHLPKVGTRETVFSSWRSLRGGLTALLPAPKDLGNPSYKVQEKLDRGQQTPWQVPCLVSSTPAPPDLLLGFLLGHRSQGTQLSPSSCGNLVSCSAWPVGIRDLPGPLCSTLLPASGSQWRTPAKTPPNGAYSSNSTFLVHFPCMCT